MDRYQKLDHISKIYDSEKDFDRHLIEYGFKVMSQHLSGPKILELGCADGVMTKMLVGFCDSLDVVDGSKKYIEKLKERLGDKIRCFVSLFEDFQPTTVYNSIILARALEHVEEPVMLLEKISGWLSQQEGSYLHIVVPNADSLHRRLGVKMKLIESCNAMSERDEKFGHKRVYNLQSLKKDIEKAGLKMVHYEGIFLKPLSNAQMESWDKKLLDAFFEIGKELPEYCAEIYAKCAKKGNQ
jgi:trans-aconitate methyltransferase